MEGRAANSSASFADPARYLQRRVALFAKIVFAFYGALLLINEFMFLIDPSDVGLVPMRVALVVLAASGGAAWMFFRRGTHPVPLLRAVELALTVASALAWVVLVLSDPIPGYAYILVQGALVIVGCVLLSRAAIVPSGAILTALLGLGCMFTLALAAAQVWNAPTPLTPAHFTFVHHMNLGALIVAVSAAISRIIHGLSARARAAMRLGQYTLREKIGAGGMGEVYAASHALLRRPTAIKLLPPERSGKEAIARFEQEVQRTSELTHPNTVSIYDFGRTSDGIFYFAMEYLEGLTLDELVDLAGPLPEARVIHILSQVAGALDEAHAAGLVHRDIKPANIAVCKRGDSQDLVKVLDFGLVKDIAAPEEMSLSATASITGTPLFLAPELMVDPKSVDGQTDLYALGAVAYYLLTGEHVFQGATVVEICGHHLHSTPERPSDRLGRPISADLESLVLECLAKTQAERPESARALRARLADCNHAGRWSRERAESFWAEYGDAIDAKRGARTADRPLTELTVARSPAAK